MFNVVHFRPSPEWELAMLSPGEIAKIKADIERLEKALDECRDKPIRELIEAWIKEQKQKLASGKNPK
jgi:hypothetical protein